MFWEDKVVIGLVAVFLAVLISLSLLIVHSEENFKQACRARGGVPVISSHDGNRCYPSKQMIDVNP